MKVILSLLLILSISLKSQINNTGFESFSNHSVNSPIALIGWYKFYPQLGDSLLFDIQVWKGGSYLNRGKSDKLSTVITNSTSVYKQLSIPIVYTVPPTNCDSARINIYPTSNLSNVVIDDLQWVYSLQDISIDKEITTVEKIYHSKIESDISQSSIYTILRPQSKSYVNVIYTVPYKNKITINVIHKTGTLLETLIDEEQSVGRYKAQIDITKIPTGVYYIEVITETGCISSTPLMIK